MFQKVLPTAVWTYDICPIYSVYINTPAILPRYYKSTPLKLRMSYVITALSLLKLERVSYVLTAVKGLNTIFSNIKKCLDKYELWFSGSGIFQFNFIFIVEL